MLLNIFCDIYFRQNIFKSCFILDFMEKKRFALIILSLALLIGSGLIIMGAEEGEMIVEANFIGFGVQLPPVISIEVPDSISIGEVTKNDPVSEKKFSINNTGTVDVVITTEIDENASEVFDYLFLRKYRSSTRLNVNDFEGQIPTGEEKQFYVGLNMTGFNETLSSNDLVLNTTIKFTAMAD